MNTTRSPSPRTRPDGALPPLDDPTARTLLAATHAGMYKWPPPFTGYRARLFVNDDGVRHSGSVTVRLGHGARVHLDGPGALSAWVQERLWAQALHLADVPFSEGDGRYGITFASAREDADRHPRGRQLVLRGGPLRSRYWVKDGRYTQIERQEPDGARRVNIIERYETAPDGRLYTTHYILIFFPRAPDTATAVESCVNEFLWRDGALLPSRRRVSGVRDHTVRTREVVLSAHEVLA